MTKIDIISGFLGAGKTTFIKKMLEEVFTGEKIVLIENEFGEIGIDGGFLKDSGIEISEMNSGCICCSLVGDFGRNLREVLERFSPDRILIEPSGVGKLSDVMKSVKDVEAEQEVVLSGLVTVVNTLKATKQMRAFGEFFNNQIEYASIIVLSRTQKASLGQLEEVVKAIREKNPKAAILTTPWEELEGKQIYKLMEQQKSLEEELMEAQIAAAAVMTTSITTMSMAIMTTSTRNAIMTTNTSMTITATARKTIMTTTIMSTTTMIMRNAIMTMSTSMAIMSMAITVTARKTIMTTTIMSTMTTATIMKVMTITTTGRIVLAAAMTTITTTIIMQMKYSQAGVWKRLINLPGM